METGWFASDDENLIETSKVFKEVGVLDAHNFLSIDMIHWMERDFVIWYNIVLYNEKDEGIRFAFSVGKSLPEDNIVYLPFINKKWWLIELDRKYS